MINPICLEKDINISRVRQGFVSGYGEYNEIREKLSDIPLKVELQIVDYDTWIQKQWQLSQVYWNKSFVAGTETAGVCPGDSGSGFYVESGGKFYLRGLVSSAILDSGYNCTHNNFAFYSDVLEYFDDFIIKVTRLIYDGFQLQVFIMFSRFSFSFFQYSNVQIIKKDAKCDFSKR